jgi:hypothetical protein
MGLVHMNGRIYDPLIGRFMSADPILQAPSMLQSHNRYSYVMNNPLNLTDPSGFSWWTRFRDKWVRPIVAIAAAVYFGPFGAGTGGFAGGGALFSSGLANAAFAGAVSGAISTGTVQGAVRGAFSGALFFGVGEFVPGAAGSAGKVLAHAAAGCVSSVASGGSCGSGALAAGFSEGIGPHLPKFDNLAANVAIRAILGGVGSTLGGGKFENGAVTGAFGYLFNELAHWQMAERASVQALRDHGWQVLEQVALKVTDTAGKSFTVIADSIALKGDMLLITEVKDGLAAKLSPGQKAMFDVAMKGGDISIIAAENAGKLGLNAGQSLFSQAGEITKLSIQLEAWTGSRAAGQMMRSLGTHGAIGVLRVLGSVGFGIVTFSSGAQ